MKSTEAIIAEDINNTFFTGNNSDKISSVQEKIDKLEEELRKQKKTLRELVSCNLSTSEESIKDLLKHYPELTYYTKDMKYPYKMHLEFIGLSQRYHMSHGYCKEAEDYNNSVFYCTFPMYTYVVNLVDNDRVTIANETNLPLDGNKLFICGEEYNREFSHPHVRETFKKGETFKPGQSGVCLGNNDFTEILTHSNVLTPSNLLDFIRRIGTWLRYINVSDKYGSPSYSAYTSVIVPYDVNEVNTLFAKMYKNVEEGKDCTYGGLQHDWNRLFKNLNPDINTERLQCTMYQILYTTWLKLNGDKFKNISGWLYDHVFKQMLSSQFSVMSAEAITAFEFSYAIDSELVEQVMKAPHTYVLFLLNNSYSKDIVASVLPGVTL